MKYQIRCDAEAFVASLIGSRDVEPASAGRLGSVAGGVFGASCFQAQPGGVKPQIIAMLHAFGALKRKDQQSFRKLFRCRERKIKLTVFRHDFEPAAVNRDHANGIPRDISNLDVYCHSPTSLTPSVPQGFP
jgi:hypothetical protein